MNKQPRRLRRLATLAGIGLMMIGLTTPARADAPPLRERVTICRNAEDGIHADRLPCVWLGPLQGDRVGHSLTAWPSRTRPHRLGLVRWIDDHRARMLWHAAVLRAEPGHHAGSLYQRINACAEVDGKSSRLPCVWHSPTMAEVIGESHVVRRAGQLTPVTDAEARRLLLTVAYR